MRGHVIILIAVVLLGVLGWLLAGDGGGPAVVDHPEGPGVLAPPDSGNGGATRDPQVVVPPDAWEVLVQLVPRGRLLPPADPVVRVFRGDQQIPAGGAVLAGAGVRWCGGTRSGRTLIRAALGGGTVIFRAVHVTAEDQAIDLNLGADALVRGRVTGPDGRPCRGAQVWCGVVHEGALVEVATDDDGRFESAVPGGEGVPIVVRAPGLAHQGRFVTASTGAPGEETFLLAEESVLVVRLAALGLRLEQARVVVFPGDDPTTDLQQFPFFLQAMDGGHRLGGTGSCTLSGLPRGGAVAVAVLHPRAHTAAATRLTLRKEHQVADVPLTLAEAVGGVVVGEDGAPLAGAAVWCAAEGRPRASPEADRWLLPPGTEVAAACVARTDDAGRFAVGRRPDRTGAVLLHLEHPGTAGLEVRVRGDGDLERPLVLPPWRAGRPALGLLPPDDRPWRVRIEPTDRDFTAVAAGQPYLRLLPEPLVLDVLLRVRRGGSYGPPRTLTGIAVLDTVEVATGEVPR